MPDGANPQALNRYSFAYNNPIMNTDPTGHAPVVAAVAAAVIVGGPVAWVGAALVTVGYFTKNPVLMTIGSVMLGYPSVFGMVVAAVTSPISPLNPKLKQAIGWAWTAYGLFAISSSGDDANNPYAQETEPSCRACSDASDLAKGNVVRMEQFRWRAFDDNVIMKWVYQTFGLNPDHVATRFTYADGSTDVYNVQTPSCGDGFLNQLKDLIETVIGAKPVFNSSEIQEWATSTLCSM